MQRSDKYNQEAIKLVEAISATAAAKELSVQASLSLSITGAQISGPKCRAPKQKAG